jgi:Domain of unknown function (DUF4160)
MPTVLRTGSLRFVMWLNDHSPAHVHVISADAEATIELGGLGARPRLVVNCGMKRADLANALRAVHENQAALLERWRAIHG